MIVLLLVGAYLMAGLAHTLSRSWAIGVHRGWAHKGTRAVECDHWACAIMLDDAFIVALHFVFWPIMLPFHWLWRLSSAVMQAPYLRGLPPKNSIDDNRDNRLE